MERERFASPGQAELKAQHTSETETREQWVFTLDPVRPKRKYFNHYANKIYGPDPDARQKEAVLHVRKTND